MSNWKKCTVTVQADIWVSEDVIDHEVFGIDKIADDFAKMAIRYGSIGAEASRVVSVERPELPSVTYISDISDIGLVGLESYTPTKQVVDVSDIGLVGL